MDESLSLSKGLWRRCVGVFDSSGCVRMIRAKAPILDLSVAPRTVYPGRETPGVVPLGLDPDEVPSATILEMVAYLDPLFRPDDLPQEIDFALDRRLYPGLGELSKGDWLSVVFLYSKQSYGLASVQKIDAKNVIVPAFGKKSGVSPT